jgi:hypothetical protein
MVAWGAEEQLPLPDWEKSEGASEILPIPSRSRLSPLLPEAPLEDRFDPFKLFIPHSMPVKQEEPPRPPPIVQLRTLDPSVLETAGQMPPDTLLFDPLGLLAEAHTEDLRRLLSNHASEAVITARILVIDHDQTLPKSASLAALASGVMTQKPTCLVVYPLGEPKRTRLFTSTDVSKATPPGYLAKLLEACVRDSEQVSDGVEQLGRLATQLSIRLFWLERAFDFKAPEPPPEEQVLKATPVPMPLEDNNQPSPAPEPTASSPVVASETSHDLLPEVVAAPPPSIIPAAALEKWSMIAMRTAWIVAALCVLIASVFVGWRWHSRRLRQMVWLLPEDEHAERLGGPHCGGSGAAIKYG